MSYDFYIPLLNIVLQKPKQMTISRLVKSSGPIQVVSTFCLVDKHVYDLELCGRTRYLSCSLVSSSCHTTVN